MLHPFNPVDPNEVRLAFVSTEYDLALTFASVALGSEVGSDRHDRNVRLARTAYESAVHFSKDLLLSAGASDRLDAKRHEVESKLRQLVATG